jgi:hypothetical protein
MHCFVVYEPTLHIAGAYGFDDEQLSGRAMQRMLQTNTCLTRLQFVGEPTLLSLIIANSDD